MSRFSRKHFEGLKPNVDNGFWKMGGKLLLFVILFIEFVFVFVMERVLVLVLTGVGAILEEVPKEGEGLKFLGSAMVASASSKEEVLEILKNDIYAKSQVWDFSKVSFLAGYHEMVGE